MAASSDLLEHSWSQRGNVLPYKTSLSKLEETCPALKTLLSIPFGSGGDVDRSSTLSTFSLLLVNLSVPGPYDISVDYPPEEIHALGTGAQFTVSKKAVNGLGGSLRIGGPMRNNSSAWAAIKTPKFKFVDEQELDVSSPTVNRQIRHMLIEITALCHPNIRGHPNIVDLVGWGTTRDSREQWQRPPFLALELADTNLAVFLHDNSTPTSVRHCIALDIGCGLDAVHDIGLIHGDMKPENVLIFRRARGWVAKLADFAGGANLGHDARLEGRGSLGWRAPELWEDSPLDTSQLAKLDSYSYGLLLWSLFLRERGSSPCDESIKAASIALAELRSMRTILPTLLYSALEKSLPLLLQYNPRDRMINTGCVLEDGSEAHDEWTARNESQGCTADTSMGTYAWEIPEISNLAYAMLQPAFSRHEHLGPAVTYAMFIKSIARGKGLHNDASARNMTFDLLDVGSRYGIEPTRAYIHAVHEHFEIQPKPEIMQAELKWISDAVAGGAFFLRKKLQHLHSKSLNICIQRFQESGGYNKFYSELDPGYTSRDILQRILGEDMADLDRKRSLNPRGDKLLHVLSSVPTCRGLPDLVELMDTQEVNALNDFGETALYRACMTGMAANVLLLLARGANPSIVPSNDWPTCLHWLFHFEPQDIPTIAQALIKHGADVHAHCQQRLPLLYYPFNLPKGTPLHWAVEMSAQEATQELLKVGANPSLRNGSDPYFFDDNVRHLDMTLPLDSIPCSIPSRPTLGFSAIDLAVMNRDHEMLDLLLSGTSDHNPNDVDEEGYTALHRLDAGEWRYTNQFSKVWSPLFQGSLKCRLGSLRRTLDVLKRHSFDLDKLTYPKYRADSDLADQTALMLAVSTGNVHSVQALIEAGANVNVTNSEGDTALLSVTRSCEHEALQSRIVTMLLEKGANIHARNELGETPLLSAGMHRLLGAVETLLKYGACPSDRVCNKRAWEYGNTIFTHLASCRVIHLPKRDSWLSSQLETYILPSLLHPEKGTRCREVLEQADLRGGTLIHYLAEAGFVRSCKALLEVRVNVNRLRKDRGIVARYHTPLDLALTGEARKKQEVLYTFPEQEAAKRLAVFEEVANLLRAAGGLQSKELLDERLNIHREGNLKGLMEQLSVH